MIVSPQTFSSSAEVLSLFLIPIGGGIPAGVIVAKNRGMIWPMMAFLYFVSDIILACVFEPILLGLLGATKRSKFLSQWAEAYKLSLAKSGFNYGPSLGPYSLIMISFGVDPMTGRAATKAAGHGFITGWTLAICGDMMFFTLISASTLWLNNILGDGTLAAVIIMIAMVGVPMIMNRFRKNR